MFGGDIGPQPVFAKILSIGYEFETSDLTKLSKTDDILVNSAIKPLNIRHKIEMDEAVAIDEHSYELMDPSVFYTEYVNELDDARTEIGRNSVVLSITNDINDNLFAGILRKKCKPIEDSVEKNDMYWFRPGATPQFESSLVEQKQSQDGGRKKASDLSIQFTSDLVNNGCTIMSSVEFIVTFFRPKKSPNVLIETFLEASRRIIAHLATLRKVKGALSIRNEDGQFIDIGKSPRALYHKPGTNLYYLQTHPDKLKSFPLSKVGMIPQMTFRAYAGDMIPIMEAILTESSMTHKMSKVRRQIGYDYDTFITVRDCVYALIAGYNKIPGVMQLPMHTVVCKTVCGYLFLILYKVHLYESKYRRWIEKARAKQVDENVITDHYLKNYLAFASRHLNCVLFHKLKEVISEWIRSKNATNKNATDVVITIINQPTIAQMYIYKGNKRGLQTINRDPAHPDYGDPAKSLVSYFLYFDTPGTNDVDFEPDESDWLFTHSIDIFTNKFDIGDNNEVMVENRLFFEELVYFAKNSCDVNIRDEVTIRQLDQMYKKLVAGITHTHNKHTSATKRVDKRLVTKPIGQYEYNPKTRRMVKKCTPGTPKNKCKPL